MVATPPGASLPGHRRAQPGDRPSDRAWGNFFNEEAFGTPTDLPWKLYIPPSQRPLEYATSDFFHPTFLYESLWDALVFVLLICVFRDRLERAPERSS